MLLLLVVVVMMMLLLLHPTERVFDHGHLPLVPVSWFGKDAERIERALASRRSQVATWRFAA